MDYGYDASEIESMHSRNGKFFVYNKQKTFDTQAHWNVDVAQKGKA